MKKEKDGIVEFEGVVETISRDTFVVAIDTGDKSGGMMRVNCVQSGRIRQNRITIAIGDMVTVEMSAQDLTRGRITFRNRK